MCKITDSLSYIEVKNFRTNFQQKIFLPSEHEERDPENLLLISRKKKRHQHYNCLKKEMHIESMIRKLELELTKKYICEMNFSLNDMQNHN